MRSGITLDEFLRTASARLCTPSPVVRALLKIRLFVGRLLGWDREPTAWETFATRLTTADLSKSLVPAGTRDGLFRVVYRFENEQLLELINRTAPRRGAKRPRRNGTGLPFLFRCLRAQGRPPHAGLHGPDRPVPQAGGLSVAPAHRSRDLEPNLRHRLTTPRGQRSGERYGAGALCGRPAARRPSLRAMMYAYSCSIR
jgi:hypothetical protein